jgi:diguanylate cyclase (GGDEF)-like protein/PAS domain S-box-containing protein
LKLLIDFEPLVLVLGFSVLLFSLVHELSKSRRQLEIERWKATQMLQSQHKRFLALLENGNDGILLLKPGGQIIYATPCTERVYGCPCDALIGRSALSYIHEEDQGMVQETFDKLIRQHGASATVEFRCRHTDGSWRWTECTGTNLLGEPSVGAIVTNYRNIETHKRFEEQLKALAVTDPLTGLANYRRLVEVLDAEIKRFDRTRRPFSLLLLDLDGLKRINDTYGHLAGSRALCRVGEVLGTVCRVIDTPARYGGDEFAVILPESNREIAEGVAERIANRFRTQSENPPISVSLGIAVCPDDGATVNFLLEKADRELYQMKNRHYEMIASR